ncbi:MAG: high-potential iron-sulfur protein [Novosphingobium sp.]
MELARRRLLAIAGIAPLALAASARAMAEEAACYDPASLPLSQKNMRRSLGYMEASNDTAKSCGACAFYKSAGGNCGSCQLLSGGAVNKGAVCTSFAAKAQ